MRRPIVVAIAIVLSLCWSASATAGRDPGGPPPPRAIIAPLPGAVLEGPVTLVLDWPPTTRFLSVHLNGIDVTDELTRARGGQRTLDLTRSHGLRHGKNSIFVRRILLGERQQNERIRFHLEETRPLASPGLAQRVAVGSRVDLTAIDSLRRPKTKKTPLSYSWKVVPPASTGLEEHPLLGETEREASFVPTAPGRYRVTLSVHDGVASHPATTEVCVVPSRPWVPINTMTDIDDNNWGVRIGDEIYRADPGGFAQLLTLDRKCLGLDANVQVPFAQDLLSEIRDLEDDVLAFVVVQPTSIEADPLAGSDLEVFNQAIGLLGGLPLTPSQGQVFDQSRFSLIGVPPSDTESTQPPGSADRRLQLFPKFAVASQSGYLVQDKNTNYKYTPAERIPFDLNPPNTPAGSVAITIGETTISESIPAGVEGGFMVVWADADDPSSHTSSIVRMNADPAVAVGDMNAFAAQLAPRSDGFNELLFVSSFGNPVGDMFFVADWLTAFNALLRPLTTVGATADTLISGGGRGYWLATRRDLTEDDAVEAASVISERCTSQGVCTPTQTGLTGTLQRDAAGYFKPTPESTGFGADGTLSRLLVQPPTLWPLDDDAGTRAALSWVTAQLSPSVAGDLRFAYWNATILKDWSGYPAQVAALKWSSEQAFTADDLAAVQKQLANELAYVQTAQTYVKNLAAPYGSDNAAFRGWVTAQNLATAIINSTDADDDDDVGLSVAQILTDLTFVAADFIPELEAFDVAGTVAKLADGMQTAVDVGSTAAGGGDDSNDLDQTLQTTVAQFAGELLTTLEDTADSLTTGVFYGLVGDWATLQEVGTHGNCIPAGKDDPACPIEWAWNAGIQAQSANSVRVAIERQLFASILSAAYGQAWLLRVDSDTDVFRQGFNAGRTVANQWRCEGRFQEEHPFVHQPDSGSTTLAYGYAGSRILYDIYALGDYGNQEPPLDAEDIHVGNVTFDPTLADKDNQVFITDRLFGALDPGGDATKGGLGQYPAWFFIRSLDAKTSALKKDALENLDVCQRT